MSMKELKIGERVTITLEVVEELTCYGCFFRTSFGKCNRNGKVKYSIRDRSDGKNVIFKQVKENMLREDLKGICHRPCIYNDNGKWDELSVPDETEKCNNQMDV